MRSYWEGDKSEAIFAARLLRGYFCREAAILPLSGHWVRVFKEYVQERKISPKRYFFGTDIPRTCVGHSRGYPGPNFGQGAQNPGKISIWVRTSMTLRGVDVHDPQGTSKNFGQKNFGLNFRSLLM